MTTTARLWTVEDVATYLGIPVKTLYEWRVKEYGPTGKRVGKHIRYKSEDVIAWFESLDDHHAA
jgi:excisionase family DNA binding protein